MENKSLEDALAAFEAKKTQRADYLTKHAPEIEAAKTKRNALNEKLAGLTQAERREVLNAAGLKHISAAPPPISPICARGVYTRAPAPVSNEAERLAERELLAAFAEAVNNGASLNWRYWVHQLPTLTTAEAARLMCGLDPDLFKSLESRPNMNDQRQLCAKAAMIQRLAEREGKESATPGEWITWAGRHQIAVHDGFRLEVESAPAQTAATLPPVVAGGTVKKWTPEKLAELKAYRDCHTEPETAKQFGISGARIRKLLPTGRPQKKPYSGFTHLIK